MEEGNIAKKNELTPAMVLAAGGLIARRLPNYEERKEQLEMAAAVAAALRERQHLIIEAGTGVGKSFGYLVPAILAATDPSVEKPPKILVSTHTISLQEQILTKDIPLLNSVMPREFSAVLVKGRRNYLSKRRLTLASRRATSLFHLDQDFDELEQIQRWSESADRGSLSELTHRPSPVVWDEVASDHGNCLGRACPTYAECFYYRDRQRMTRAQILVVNHALFFSDLALRAKGIKLLPDYGAVILDEAHTIASTAGSHLGLSVSSGQVDYVLSRLYNDRTNKGLLVHNNLRQEELAVDRCRDLADEFFNAIHVWFDSQRSGGGRVTTRHLVENQLSDALDELADMIARAGKSLPKEQQQDFTAASNRLSALAAEIDHWLTQSLEGGVYWVELERTRRGSARVKLLAAPIDVGVALKQHLFEKVETVIMASATLATGQGDDFGYFQQQVGLTQSATKRLGSPFDYRRQAKLVVMRGMPDPRDSADYNRLSAAMIQRYAERSDGRSFALFTSYRMLGEVADQLRAWASEKGMRIFSQADGMPRTRMLDEFKSNPKGVLLGTDSFWQGVDVPGDALQTVIITKLPFSVPDQPLLAARLEAIRDAGGNPFYDVQIPEAIIKLRQGFGRLIRTSQDHGTVVLLDPRIRTKPYGRKFVESLPDCEIVEESVGSELRA